MIVDNRRFELRVTDDGAGRPRSVFWPGRDGRDAARRYADAHPGAVVMAWREPRWAFVPGVDPRQIIG